MPYLSKKKFDVRSVIFKIIYQKGTKTEIPQILSNLQVIFISDRNYKVRRWDEV
jgi:hypothetical protein